MRKFALGLVALTLATSAALAQTPITFAQIDLDGDGRISFAELQAVWPDISETEFATADVEGAGSLTPDQLNTLQQPTVGNGEALTEVPDVPEPATLEAPVSE